MPPLGQSGMHDDAVLWVLSQGFGDYSGTPAYDSSPQALRVRWEPGRTLTRGPDGSLVAVDAQVWVNRRVEPKSLLWRGNIDDLPPVNSFADLSPDVQSEIMEVVTYNEVPDVKGRDPVFRLGLAWWRQTQPS